MKFRTRHLQDFQPPAEGGQAAVFIEDPTSVTVMNRPMALPGKFLTLSSPLVVSTKVAFAATMKEARVRVPMFRYTVPHRHPALFVVAMLELGILARQALEPYLHPGERPTYCHLFVSDVFNVDQAGGPYSVFFGVSFEFGELEEDQEDEDLGPNA